MAELISIRNPQMANAVEEKTIDTNNDMCIANPAFANDTDIGLDNLGESDETDSVRTGNGLTSEQKLQGTTISFHNISYTVDTKVGRKKVKQNIINGISGIFSPGMNAILGPTGCGKTSTLDMLADRKDITRVSGDIMVNGVKKPSNFKRITGYVVQHDVVMGVLTVRENIYFSASLRLPSSMSSKQKQDKVDKLIDELGLSKVADSKNTDLFEVLYHTLGRVFHQDIQTPRSLFKNLGFASTNVSVFGYPGESLLLVGTELIRGISGGEKRRTGIGMELIITPQVLFLDEPTTGLDASTACSVMQLLHDLSRKGNTIIFSIHQPRYSIFKLFDTICLLADGNTVYHGSANKSLEYFEEIGYTCEPHNNPPDFFLDVINSTKTKKSEGDDEVDDIEKGEMTCMDLIRKFQESSHGQAMKEEVQDIMNNLKVNADENESKKKDSMNQYATGYLTQLAIVGQRSVRSLIRNPQTSIVQLCVMIFLGLIVGALFFQLEKDESGIQNRVGAFFFIVMNMVFANLDSIELLIKERSIFIHEVASGYYRVSVYFLAKTFGEFLPYRTLSAIIFATIAYWMVGFQSDAGKFFIFVLTVVQVSTTACSLSFLLSATFGVFAIANLMAAVAYVIMMVFGGLLLNQDSFGDWIGWFRYLSIFKYGLECVNINELDGMMFGSSIVNSTTQCAQSSGLSGSVYLKQQGIDVDMLWWNELILFAMTIVLCFLTYIQLRRVNKDK